MTILDLVYGILAAATYPAWSRKSRSGWGERLGRIAPLPEKARARVLLHTVSVGETAAVRELVPLLAREAEVVVSCTTDTGLARARELYGATCRVVRYPLDFSGSVERFLDAARPDVVALVELELWPQMVRACGRRGIPVCVINGRLSERSFRGYRKLRWFLRRSFAALEFAAVQDETYAARFEAMGVPENRCLVTGSMKWDTARIRDEVAGAPELGAEMGIDPAVPLVVAGSTAEGEEALLDRAVGRDVQLVCAPRKPERFGEASAAMAGSARRTAGRAPAGTRRFVLDTIGELGKLYARADVVVIGRTFAPERGSDPIEPVGLGKATVVGPDVRNFESITRALEGAGGIVRATQGSLAGVLAALLADPARRREIAERGRECIREHQGATARHAELLLDLAGRAERAGPAAEMGRAGRGAGGLVGARGA